MKLRIQRNSLRLRVSRSELARFLDAGRIEETIRFGPGPGAELTYALARNESGDSLTVEYSPNRVVVALPGAQVYAWSATEAVGIAGEVDLGIRGMLSVLVEKDFACLDRSEEENEDTFANPLATAQAC